MFLKDSPEVEVSPVGPAKEADSTPGERGREKRREKGEKEGEGEEKGEKK